MLHLTTESTYEELYVFFYKIIFKNEEGKVVLEDEFWGKEESFVRDRARETLAELIQSTRKHYSAEIILCFRPIYYQYYRPKI